MREAKGMRADIIVDDVTASRNRDLQRIES